MNGRVVARRLADGRTEFGFQPDGAERILPRSRYFPAKARVDCWLQSSLVTVDGQEIGRINDRLLAVGNDNSTWPLMGSDQPPEVLWQTGPGPC